MNTFQFIGMIVGIATFALVVIFGIWLMISNRIEEKRAEAGQDIYDDGAETR